jgi:hypothetical protein
MKRIGLGWAVALALAGSMCATAQTVEGRKAETVAVLPWIFLKGTDGAVKTAKERLTDILTTSAFEIAQEADVRTAWSKMGRSLDPDRAELPSAKALLQLGHKLGVDYVLTGRAQWHTRSIWVGFGPKTKSTCTVDLIIVDVKKDRVALNARKVWMDSTTKEDPLKAAGAVLLTPLVTVVSGGPKTPHEQRAAQLAIGKAIKPWLEQRAARSER